MPGFGNAGFGSMSFGMKRITAITWRIVGGECRSTAGGETSSGHFEARTGGAPVNHGLVEYPTDWPYSSIHRDIRAGQVDPEWSGVVTDGTFGEP